MGRAEMAIQQIWDALSENIGIPGPLVLWSACDAERHCRKVLRHMYSTSSRRMSPRRVFGDMLDRVDEAVRGELWS
eukprot:1112378-Lingulodinium_polyedra.AAC.1